MAATIQALSPEFGITSKAFKAFRSFVRSGEANGDHIGTTVPIRVQNRHHLPHLPVLRTGKAVLPGIHHRCCNSHFGSQVKRGHSVLAELRLNPVCHRFHLHRQGVRLWLFPCFRCKFRGNMSVCNTQQGYSPPMGARETEVVGFSRFGGSMRATGRGEFSPRPNDSLAPARSALGGPPLSADSFRCFPSNSSPPFWGGEGEDASGSTCGSGEVGALSRQDAGAPWGWGSS